VSTHAGRRSSATPLSHPSRGETGSFASPPRSGFAKCGAGQFLASRVKRYRIKFVRATVAGSRRPVNYRARISFAVVVKRRSGMPDVAPTSVNAGEHMPESPEE
jgi:hypothetical protein